MNITKKLSLANKIGIVISIWFSIAFATLTAIVGRNMYLYQRENIKQDVLSQAIIVQEQILLELNKPMMAAQSIANALSASKNLKLTREDAMKMAERVLYSNKNYLGFTIGFEPNAFDSNDKEFVNAVSHDTTGRFLVYLTKGENQKAVREVLIEYENSEIGPWYWQPKLTKSGFINPVFYPVQGKDVAMSSFMAPILDGDKFLGVTGIDYPIDFLQEFVSKLNLFNGEYSLAIVSESGKIIADSGHPDLIFKNMKNLDGANDFKTINAKIQKGERVSYEKNGDWIVHLPMKVTGVDSYWQVEISVPFSLVTKRIIKILLIQIIIVVIIALLSTFLISRYISHKLDPIGDVVKSAQAISQGNLTIQKTKYKRQDEIGILFSTFTSMSKKLQSIVREVQEATKTIAVSSKSLSDTSDTLSATANEQAASFEEIASTIKNVSTTVVHNNTSIKEIDEKVSHISKRVQGIGNLSQKSLKGIHQINDKVHEITSISSQTNILALNTGIEAARAGIHGKSFAVVASEVRTLAERSKNLSDAISKLIDDSVEISENIEKDIKTVIEDTHAMVISISQSNERLEEQAANATQISQTIDSLSEITQDNALKSEVLSLHAEKLETKAQLLQEQIDFFH